MESLVTTSGILTLVSAVVGIFSALRSTKLAREKFELEQQQGKNAHRASLIDDIEQVLNTVKEENGRLVSRVEDLEIANRALAKANDHLAKANDHLAARVGQLEAAYKVETEKNARLTERVEELEGDRASLRRYRADE